MLSSRSRNFALTPPIESKYTPDQTAIGAAVEGEGAVVTLAEVKTFLPLNVDTYDAAINKLIPAVTRAIESYTRLDVIKKQITSYWYRVPRVAILARGIHGDITSVVSIDSEGTETVLVAGDDYEVEGMLYKRLVNIDATGALKVVYESGFATADRPEQFHGAILQEIALQFKNRNDPDGIPMTSVHSLSLEARHLLSTVFRRAF